MVGVVGAHICCKCSWVSCLKRLSCLGFHMRLSLMVASGIGSPHRMGDQKRSLAAHTVHSMCMTDDRQENMGADRAGVMVGVLLMSHHLANCRSMGRILRQYLAARRISSYVKSII